MRLEKAINPLLDDNDQVALSYMFEIIIGKMKAVENVSLEHYNLMYWNCGCKKVVQHFSFIILLQNKHTFFYNSFNDTSEIFC